MGSYFNPAQETKLGPDGRWQSRQMGADALYQAYGGIYDPQRWNKEVDSLSSGITGQWGISSGNTIINRGGGGGGGAVQAANRAQRNRDTAVRENLNQAERNLWKPYWELLADPAYNTRRGMAFQTLGVQPGGSVPQSDGGSIPYSSLPKIGVPESTWRGMETSATEQGVAAREDTMRRIQNRMAQSGVVDAGALHELSGKVGIQANRNIERAAREVRTQEAMHNYQAQTQALNVLRETLGLKQGVLGGSAQGSANLLIGATSQFPQRNYAVEGNAAAGVGNPNDPLLQALQGMTGQTTGGVPQGNPNPWGPVYGSGRNQTPDPFDRPRRPLWT